MSSQQIICSLLIILITCLSSIITRLRSCHLINLRHKNKYNALPPSPKAWPIVGNIPEMFANKPAFRWIHQMMKEMNTEIACIHLGNVFVIPVTCPNIACEFLKKHDANFASRPISMSTNLVSKGYLTSAVVPFGEQWKKMKKIVSINLLSPINHHCFHDKRAEEANNLSYYVYNKCNIGSDHHGLVNVRFVVQHYCGNVIRKLIFNTRYFGQNRKDGGPSFEEEQHVDAILTSLKYLYAFCISDYIPCLRGFDLDGHESKLKNAMRIINSYHDPLIEERIKLWNDGLKIKKEDMLDILISLKDANNIALLTAEEIKAEIIELMMAVVDNPSNVIEWALAEMINQPELLQRATEELDIVVGKERQIEESDIPNLNYVNACLREAFRLHPVAPFNLPHVSMKDTVVGGYLIPKDSHVILSRRGLGRNSRFWDEPYKFKPERHLKNDGSKVTLTETNLRFISFSTGMRGCPGVKLGTIMTIMPFARLLHGFTWNVPPNVSSVNLVESTHDLLLAQPLIALAKPRLAAKLYQ